MKLAAVLALILMGLAAGCKRYGGGFSGSFANSNHQNFTEVEAQRDPNGNFVFVIAYLKTNGAASSSSFSGRNLLTAINGHRIHPNINQRAVYALQPDASLKQIPLTDDQIVGLFREMQDTNFHTLYSKFWQMEIAPHLTNGPAIRE